MNLPYGETWIDEGSDTSLLGYKFTGKELDEETGYYYFGARYYDPQISMWISTDPALDEYLPRWNQVYFPEKKFNANNLKGAGGIYKSMNSNLYHYASINPMKYIDPDGNQSSPGFQPECFSNPLTRMFLNLANDPSQLMDGVTEKLQSMPLSLSFWGITISPQFTMGPKLKIGPAEVGYQMKATTDENGNIKVDLKIGMTNDKGKTVGYSVTLMKDGKMQVSDVKLSAGLKKSDIKAMLNVTDKDYEIGVGVGSTVGVEVKVKPAVFLENLLKAIDGE